MLGFDPGLELCYQVPLRGLGALSELSILIQLMRMIITPARTASYRVDVRIKGIDEKRYSELYDVAQMLDMNVKQK